MAHFYDSSQSNTRMGLGGDMNFNSFDFSQDRQQKELAPPPVDPFSASSGLYIPPEETKPAAMAIDELTHWGMSDDQQDTEDEDDEMDDNEFDLDFEDADYPPPMRTHEMTLEQASRHLSQPQFNVLASLPYVHPELHNPSRENSLQMSRAMDNNSPPVRFVNPNSLHLPYYWQLTDQQQPQPQHSQPQQPQHPSYDNNATQYDTTNFDAASTGNNTNPVYTSLPMQQLQQSTTTQHPHPHSHEPQHELNESQAQSQAQSQQPLPQSFESNTSIYTSPDMASDLTSPGLDLDFGDLSGDMELFPLSPAESHHDDITEIKSNTEKVSEPQVPEPKIEVAPKAEAHDHSHIEDAPSHDHSHIHSHSHSHSHAPVAAKRKAPRRKTASRSNAAHTSVHVCTMKYPDGSECGRSFTRPYDLARHQETLHAAVRKTYTCEICGENSKTFSRLDALSRHMRLKHS